MKTKLLIICFVLMGCMSTTVLAQDSLRIAILGDSYSTFEGFIPKNYEIWYFSENNPRRNGILPNDVSKVEQTWWYQVVDRLNAKLEKNNSYSGSTISCSGYKKDVEVKGDYSDRTFMGRVYNLGNPDVILVFGGTNDDWARAPIGEYTYENWTKEQLKAFRPAMAKLLYELKMMYPKARLLFMLNTDLRDVINESVKEICQHYDVQCLVLKDIDKLKGHPSVKGMKSISDQVVEALLVTH